MRSFAGIAGTKPDARLLQQLGSALRLPSSSMAEVLSDDHCGVAVVAHRGEPLIARDGNAWLAGNVADAAEVLREWRRRGTGVAAHLEGEYSFAIWDGASRELFCVRDRFGVRPFYYTRIGEALLFSDTLGAIVAHPDANVDELDDGAVRDYLSGGISNDAAATIYARVRRLPPGHTLHWREGGDVVTREYWRPREPEEPSREDLRPRLEAALKSALRDRVRGASAVVFMSGGLDSTTLAALTREALPHVRLSAFTSIYRSRIPDEEESYAAEAAQSIGIPIDLFPLDDYGALGAIEAGLWLPEPGPLLMAAMTRDIHVLAAQKAAVALHGHPADALLIGELTPFLQRLLRRGQLLRFATALLQYIAIRRRPPYFLLRRTSWSKEEGLRPQSIRALRSAIWSSYFEWAHPSMTGAPIELSYPYADARVVDVLLAAEPIPSIVDKHVLRDCLRGRVSERVRRRPKTPLQGNPWILKTAADFPIVAAASYIDGQRLANRIRTAGALDDSALRAVAFEYWLRELPGRVRQSRVGMNWA